MTNIKSHFLSFLYLICFSTILLLAASPKLIDFFVVLADNLLFFLKALFVSCMFSVSLCLCLFYFEFSSGRKSGHYAQLHIQLCFYFAVSISI